jgi:hypothetical protein
VRSANGLERLESFLLDLWVDTSGDQPDPRVDVAMAKLEDAFLMLRGDPPAAAPLLHVGPWPTRRVGIAGHHALSLLSSGELDVLVTVGEIVAQQLYLQRTLDLPADVEPAGVVLIDEVDAHLHPQWQQKVLPLYAELFPTIQFIVTTHSPFVLRSLPRDKAFILRLPEGHVFDEDFGAWSIEDILETVFAVPGSWSAEIKAQLQELERSISAPERTAEQGEHAIEVYLQLARRSPTLRAQCDKILALHADAVLRDRIRERENGAP